MMLVKELIEELKKYDGNLKVEFCADADDYFLEFDEVRPGTDYVDEDMDKSDAVILW